MVGHNLLRRILPAAAGLMLVAAACSGSVASAQDIQGLLRAVEGKQLIIQLDDGSTVRVEMKDAQATPEVHELVGHEVKATIGGDRHLVKVERRLVNDDNRGRGRGEGRGRGGDDLLREDQPRDAAAEDVHFSGAIESIRPDAFVIGGKTFQVNSATELDEGLVKGVEARVEFLMQADGSLLATEIETDADDELVQPGQVAPQADDQRGRGLDDRARMGDDRRGPNRGPGEGEVRGGEREVGGTEPAVRDVEDFHFNGLIEAMSANSFTIGGKTFKVDGATTLDNGLAVGVLARVEFITLPDGSLLANEIETDAPDEVMPQVQPQAGQAPAPQVGQPGQAAGVVQDFHFSGVIQSMGAGTWVIGGRTFRVDGSTMLDTGLVAGVVADVEFAVLPDGTFHAIKIETGPSGKNR